MLPIVKKRTSNFFYGSVVVTIIIGLHVSVNKYLLANKYKNQGASPITFRYISK